MTTDGQPPHGQMPAPSTLLPGWSTLAAGLEQELIVAGKLHSPAWRTALAATPRHLFVPEFYEHQPDGRWDRVSAGNPLTRPQWIEAVYANRSLVTQLGPIADGGRQRTGPTSSASAPSLVTRMLEALDVRDDHRVLEIGTGTGYNAALLCHRLDDTAVASIDIDPLLVVDARERLGTLGYRPTLTVRDGAAGLAEHAPYDRIIATCAVRHLPPSWAEQVTPDGLVLVDLKVHATVGNLVLLRNTSDRLEGRFDPGTATFMQMRSPTLPVIPPPAPDQGRDRSRARRRIDTTGEQRLWTTTPLWFLIHLAEPGPLRFGLSLDPSTGEPANEFYVAHDGSWCEIVGQDDDIRLVFEGGPRPLWTTMHRTIGRWQELGRPGWDRLGLTVWPSGRHDVWIDAPGGADTWCVP